MTILAPARSDVDPSTSSTTASTTAAIDGLPAKAAVEAIDRIDEATLAASSVVGAVELALGPDWRLVVAYRDASDHYSYGDFTVCVAQHADGRWAAVLVETPDYADGDSDEICSWDGTSAEWRRRTLKSAFNTWVIGATACELVDLLSAGGLSWPNSGTPGQATLLGPNLAACRAILQSDDATLAAVQLLVGFDGLPGRYSTSEAASLATRMNWHRNVESLMCHRVALPEAMSRWRRLRYPGEPHAKYRYWCGAGLWVVLHHLAREYAACGIGVASRTTSGWRLTVASESEVVSLLEGWLDAHHQADRHHLLRAGVPGRTLEAAK